jgi:hypothetical protein
MASLFGYTSPDILNRYQKDNNDDSTTGYQISWVRSMENFKETKEKFGEYPKVNKTVIPDEFKEFTINDIAANFQPMARLNNSFYNGVQNDKHYSYGQQVYIPESYPNHYYNTNMFSPLFLAMNKEKKPEEDMLTS